MKRKKKKEEFVDDGRVIAPMNVDGMPYFSGMRVFGKRHNEDEDNASDPDERRLSPSERRRIVLTSMLAGAILSLIFIGAAALVIWLITVIA